MPCPLINITFLGMLRQTTIWSKVITLNVQGSIHQIVTKNKLIGITNLNDGKILQSGHRHWHRYG